MRLFLVRHGQSDNNRAAENGLETRVPDPTLTELGFAQAEALSQAWHELPGYCQPDVILTSLMRRTIETIIPSAEALDLPILAQMDTHEIGGPYLGPWSDCQTHPGSARSVLEGLTSRVVIPDQASEEGWYHLGFETRQTWQKRASQLWQRLLETYSDATVVLVNHGSFGAELLKVALHTDATLRLANTGTALIEVNQNGSRLRWFNRVDHLSAQQLTDFVPLT